MARLSNLKDLRHSKRLLRLQERFPILRFREGLNVNHCPGRVSRRNHRLAPDHLPEMT